MVWYLTSCGMPFGPFVSAISIGHEDKTKDLDDPGMLALNKLSEAF